MAKNLSVIFLSLLITILLSYITCDRNLTGPYENRPPNTTLANIPVGDGDTMIVETETGLDTIVLKADTLFALVTLHWDGEDEDGYIAGYQYRYTTYHLSIGDSFVTEWEDTNATSVTIAFESSDDLNYQRFQVRAVDNDGDVDPTPAEKKFYTRKAIFPTTEIIFPEDGGTFYIIDETTDWWSGIKISFTAKDEDGEIVEYAWAVDGGEWNWTKDTTLYIHPDHFNPKGGVHYLKATSRDNTNLVDPIGDSVRVKLIEPNFSREILIVDETREGSFPSGVTASDADVDSFYFNIFGDCDVWDYFKRGVPSKDTLGYYKLIIWHADNPYTSPSDYHQLPQHTDILMDYMNVGGDFIMSGWRILSSFQPERPFPITFEPGSFVRDYLHIITAGETGRFYEEFKGAYGPSDGSFSPVSVDSLKLANVYMYLPPGTLGQINYITLAAGFTDYILFFDRPGTSLHGMPVGLRYYGTVFNAVILGFPLFFIEEEDAKVLASEILESLGYQVKN